MATVDKYMKYPSNLLDAMKRNSPSARAIAEDTLLYILKNPKVLSRLTPRDKEIIEVRYKTWHNCKEAGEMIHPPVSGGRFAEIENRLLRKLTHYARCYGGHDDNIKT